MKIINLTKQINDRMSIFSDDSEVTVEIVHTYEKKNWLLWRLIMRSHTGTHVDVFSHLDK